MIKESDVWAAIPPHGFMRTLVQYAEKKTDAPLAYSLGAALATTAVLAPPCTMSYGADVGMNFYGLLVGTSGNARKTTVVSMVQKIVTYVDATRILPEPESAPALVETMHVTPQGILLFPEMGDFFTSTGNGSYKQPVLSMMTRIYDGSPITKSKVGETMVVRDPRLSVLGAIATSFLESATDPGFWTNGGMGRYFLIDAAPERLYEPPPFSVPGYDFMLHEAMLLAVKAERVGPCLGWGGLDGYWRDKVNELLAYGKSLALDSNMAVAGVARARTTAIKAAMLYEFDVGTAHAQATDAPGAGWSLTKAGIDFGMAIAKMHMDSVNSILGGLAYNEYERKERSIYAVVSGGRMFPRSALLAAVKPRMLKRDFDQTLETMLHTGTVHQVNVAGGGMYIHMNPPARDELTNNPLTWDPATGAWI